MSATSEIEEEQGSNTSTSSPRGQFSAQNPLVEEMFVRHKVSKLDTLAGLAVRYHVTVSDIKRANGLLSDTAMFARDTLLIPTRPLPVGAEYSTWAGMIVMQYGKLRAKERCPANMQYGKVAGRKTSIDELRGYYSTSPGGSPKSTSGSCCAWFGGIGPPQRQEHDDEDEQQGSGANGLGWRSSREVELMTRSASGASTSYADDRLRRRKTGEAEEPGSSPPGSAAAGSGSSGMMSFLQRPLASLKQSGFRGGGGEAGGSSRAAGGSSSSHDLRRPPGRRKESLLDKLKKVASQPALAVSSAPVSIAQAAEAVINSALLPPKPPGGEQGGANNRQQLQQAAYNLVNRPKEVSKAD